MKKVLFISLILIVSLFYSCKDEPVAVIITTSSDVLNVDPMNASTALTITVNSAWKAKSSNNWCTLSDSTGTGSKSIVLLCNDNLTGKSRETTLSIQAGSMSKSVVVKQYGGLALLDENYNDNGLNWVQHYDSVLNSINNGYFDINNSGNYYSYFIGNRSIINKYTGNYMIMMGYTIITGTAPFGLTFGFKDNQNFYRILIYPQGTYYVTVRLNNLTSTLLSGHSTAIKSENAISLVKMAKNCDFYINNTKIGTFDLSTPYGPYVGFYSCPQTDVAVDYLKVFQF